MTMLLGLVAATRPVGSPLAFGEEFVSELFDGATPLPASGSEKRPNPPRRP